MVEIDPRYGDEPSRRGFLEKIGGVCQKERYIEMMAHTRRANLGWCNLLDVDPKIIVWVGYRTRVQEDNRADVFLRNIKGEFRGELMDFQANRCLAGLQENPFEVFSKNEARSIVPAQAVSICNQQYHSLLGGGPAGA